MINMTMIAAIKDKLGLAMAGKSPWGPSGGNSSDDGSAGQSGGNAGSGSGEGEGPRNPWAPASNDDGHGRRGPNIEDIFKRRGQKGGGSGGGFGGGGPHFSMPSQFGGKNWLPLGLMIGGGLWLALTSIHQIGPKEQAVVTWLGGKYSSTLSSGINFTLPAPLQKVDIESVRDFRIEIIPENGGGQRLMLTGDQNLVDLSYSVRWNIKNLKQFRFQLVDPSQTVREVAEAAMRASVAEQTLDQVISGAGRARVEGAVLKRMQTMLDAYRSGVAVQGVQIDKTDPPKEVEQSFKDVSAAQQDAESYRNQAEAAAQQVLARAQGDAAAFNKVYEQYKLAPQVTRQRMYYETMERVLRQNDKTIVETNGVTTYLPLPEMRRSQAAKQGGQ